MSFQEWIRYVQMQELEQDLVCDDIKCNQDPGNQQEINQTQFSFRRAYAKPWRTENKHKVTFPVLVN